MPERPWRSFTEADAAALGVPNAELGSVLPVLMLGYNQTTGQANIIQLATADNAAPYRAMVAANYLFNDDTSLLERERPNVSAILLASAARTATTASPDQVNRNRAGTWISIDVTVAGTGSLNIRAQGKDKATGNYYTIDTSSPIFATGTYRAFFPGLPRDWRGQIVSGDGSSWTYSSSSSNSSDSAEGTILGLGLVASAEYTAQQTDAILIAAPGAGLCIDVTDILIIVNGIVTVTLEEDDTADRLLWKHYGDGQGSGQAPSALKTSEALKPNKALLVTTSAAVTVFVRLGYRLHS